MPGLNTNELVVGNGRGIYAAPAGTTNVALATTPATPWVDLGYANEDGVTLADSPSEETVPAWQSADPVLVLTTANARTFAFNHRQWTADVLTFVFGGGMVTPDPPAGKTFAPTKTTRGKFALIMRWTDQNGAVQQFYVARGRVTGDVGAQLTRTAAGVLSVTFTSTPDAGLAEDAWRYTTDSGGLTAGTLVAPLSGEPYVEPAASGKAAA